MNKEIRKRFCVSFGLLVAFLLWTLAVKTIDVRTIGPRESEVGLAAVNGVVHEITGVNMPLYTVTDWLGLVPIGVAFGFGVSGLIQWIRRKSFLKVDYSILALGVFYIVVMAVYLLFETVVINYRPVIIQGCLEASYPSSTTMLVLCVMPTAIMQFNARIKNSFIKLCVDYIITAFIIFMVVGRIVSGVHWITDIIGGVLLSAGLVMMYYSFCSKLKLEVN